MFIISQFSDNNLLAHYKFNAGLGDTLYDHSGNGNHGTIHGATWECNDEVDCAGVCGGVNICGCTDPLAINDVYNPDATFDDGSCAGY